MPKRYDEEFKARAVRLVTDHAEEYNTPTACIVAVLRNPAPVGQPGRGVHQTRGASK
jgi:hypothetical protein